MKTLPLLLAASLVANAAFVTTSVVRTVNSSADQQRISHSSTAAAAHSAGSSAAKAGTAAPADILEALKTDNIEALRDFLRVAGVPDDTIRSIVASTIWKRYSERMKALQPKPDPNRPWWKQNNDWYSRTSREDRAELRRLQREATDETLRVLGPDKNNSGWGWQDPRLSFLPEEKRRDLQEVEQDYQDLIQEVQQDMQGFTLPSDAEKIRFLMEEKKRDLAAILSPQEMADYDLRMSRTAQQLSWKMTKFDASEEEYRKIFALQKSFDDTQNLDAWGNPLNQSPESWQKRQQDEKQLKEQLKASLGAERYADYVRSQNNEFQQLQAAAKRLSLPPETATKVFDLRNEVSAQSVRIVDDANLAVEQKQQELAALAKRTRDQVRASLGDEAAEVYLKNLYWLKNVEQGQAVTFTEDGNGSNARGIPTPPKKPATKP